MEQMLWDAACSIRGEKDAPKFKDYLLPLLFLKRLSDVFDDEVERLAEEYGDRKRLWRSPKPTMTCCASTCRPRRVGA
jgi:type I restriction-modification system DNA methylase subunit